MTLRDKIMTLLGQLKAIRYPILPGKIDESQAYYDLIDSMEEQFIAIIKEIYPDFKEY